MGENNLKIINLSEVETKEISWLWYPFIPYGKLTIIQGDPGEGKTTLVLNIAAVLFQRTRTGRLYETERTIKHHLSDGRGWIGRYRKAESGKGAG